LEHFAPEIRDTAVAPCEKQITGLVWGQAMENHHDPVEWLRWEYSQRRGRNSSYSLRAFARHLSLSSGALSEIFVKKRPLTVKQGDKIAARLGYSPNERLVFLGAIRALHAPEVVPVIDKPFTEVTEQAFRIVSDWYHYAIRELVETVGFKSDPRWIAERLGISVTEVKGALTRLEKTGLIEKNNLSWKTSQSVTTHHDVPSHAQRHFHRQSLDRVKSALDEVPLELRDITAITMAIDVSKLNTAKEEIKKFRRRLSQILEQGRKTEVYQLNIQLIPLTREEKTSK
jgi:uncharacterized protein (TIGR02147 family)